ncbi:MAG: pyridoxamine 5'-phosphate oxidase family protein [Propionibacteriales bacterium]|nr:pyridoxamine 5'-phosphate oxidase family protein [Propionibacteriales bacterium]
MWAVWDDGEHRLAFSCGHRSRMARNVDAKPQVTVALDDTVECLTLEGQAGVVSDEARREEWVRRYVGKFGRCRLGWTPGSFSPSGRFPTPNSVRSLGTSSRARVRSTTVSNARSITAPSAKIRLRLYSTW